MASLANVEHRNQDATVYVANLDYACTQTVLLELFAQVGKVKSIYMPTDKITGSHNGYGFVEFTDVLDADYAIQILNMIKFYDRPLKLGKSSLRSSKAELWSKDVGANLFIGNLDPIDVDEHLLYDTFSSFGTLLKQPKIMREDNDTNDSKGFGFVSFDNFESSDTAIECMNSQFLCSRQIIVQYAFKKDTTTNSKDGNNTNTTHSHERHGSRAERMLAAQRNSQQNKQQQKQQPTTRNNSAMPRPGMPPPMMMMNNNNMNNNNNMMGMGMGMGNNMNRNMNMNNNSGMSSMGMGVPPPPPPPMMNMMGGSSGGGGYNGRSGGGSQQAPPPGNYGPGPVSNSGGFGNNTMGGGGRGGRGRGLSMTQPAWMTQQQQGLEGMPPPPPPTMMGGGGGGGGAPPPPPPPPPLPPMMQSQSQAG
jgi:splicing factor 3B subunit 4